jgi:RNA recognition motif-containing protein
MGNNLFVAGLPYELTESELTKLFSASGTVTSAKILMERETGRSRGIGFVLMATDAEAQAAIKALNGATVGGRPIFVSEARPKEAGPAGGGYTGPERRLGKDRRRQPSSAAKPWEKKRAFGDKKPWEKKAGFGDKKPWEKKAGFGDKKPWERKAGSGDEKPWEKKAGFGDKKPWEKKAGFGDKKPWEKKAGFGDKKPWEKKAGFGEKKPWEKKSGFGDKKKWGAGGPSGGRKPGDFKSKPGGFKRKPSGGYRG